VIEFDNTWVIKGLGNGTKDKEEEKGKEATETEKSDCPTIQDISNTGERNEMKATE